MLIAPFHIVPEYDVTHPFQVDESGNFVSYELHEHTRRKRNADRPDVFNYKIKAFGLSLHLNLTTPSTLFRPGFVVETFYENGSKKLSEPPYTAFFNGHVTSDPNSIVAISNHDGLVGAFVLLWSNTLLCHRYAIFFLFLHESLICEPMATRLNSEECKNFHQGLAL